MGCCSSSDANVKRTVPHEPVATAVESQQTKVEVQVKTELNVDNNRSNNANQSANRNTALHASSASNTSSSMKSNVGAIQTHENDENKNDNNNIITFAIPPYEYPAAIDKVVETIKTKNDFIEAGEALENALHKMANNDDDKSDNIVTESSPLVDVLLRHRERFSPSSSLSLVAAAINFIYETEMNKKGAGANVAGGVYSTHLRRLFTKSLTGKWDVDDDSFTDELVTSWNSILSPFVPRAAVLLLLKSRVPHNVRTVAALVAEEYSRKIRFSCRTLAHWKTFPGSCSLTAHTIKVVKNYFAAEIELIDRLEKVNRDLANREDQQSRLDIEKNERFIEKIGQQEFPVELLDSFHLSGIVTLGGWIEQRKIFIEQPEKVAENRALDFLGSFFQTQLSQLRQLYIRRFQALITIDTIQSLRSGSTPLFSKRPPYGLRSRHKEFESLCTVLKEFRKNTKASCPLIDVSTMPRQGKTTLLDAIGYSPEVLRAFDEDSSNVFVLFLNFNAMWPCKIKTDDASTALDAAKRHISLRLLAGACGIHRASAFLLRPHATRLVESLTAVLRDPKLVLEDVILPRLSQLASIPQQNIKIVIAADEFSNLEPKSYDSFVIEKCRQALYSMMANLSSSRVAVVVSGFTPIPDIQSTTGRAVKQIALCPFNTTVSRQESLPMRSEFFRLVSTMDINKTQSIFNEPVAVFELVKASPGIFGALVEMKHDMKTSVGEAVERVPFLLTLESCSSHYWSYMSAMLQWKSVQAAAKNLDNAAFGELTNESGVQLVAHFPREAVLSPSCIDHLALIRIDPMFLARTTNRSFESEFNTFLRQLNNYGYQVTHDLTKGNFSACKRLIQHRFERANEQSMRFISNIVTPANWTSYFFHEAVATGILYQTELRRSFMFRNDVEKITFTLGDFLKGANSIGSLQKETNTTNGESAVRADELELMWSVQFKKNAAQKDGENATAEANTVSQQLPQGISPGPSSIAYFNGCPKILKLSLDTLHQPACRDDNNLADMVFHLATAADGNRWVEVWIDINHSSSAPFKKQNDPGIFPSSETLQESLANDMLQSEDSHVDHVVHIVVTVCTPSEMTLQLPKVDLGRLKSYSLFYVHPDSTAFENLVSQPIKEAIPTLDQHDERNWTLDLPPEIDDWKYYRATKRDIVEHFSSADEFIRWRNICFDEDCSITLGNLNPELPKILPREIRSVPLGCVIEALGIRPFSVNTLQKRYNYEFRVEISNGQVQFFEHERSIFDTPCTGRIFQQILSQIKIGHLMHHETDFWNQLFSHDKEKKVNEKFLSQEVWNAPVSDADRLALSVKNALGNAAKILLDSALAKLRSGLKRR